MNQKMHKPVMIVRNGENFYAGRAQLVDGEYRNVGPIAHAGGSAEAFDALMKLEKEIEERKAAEHQKQVDKLFGDITEAINQASKMLGIEPVDISGFAGNTTFNRANGIPEPTPGAEPLFKDQPFRTHEEEADAMETLTQSVVKEVYEAVEHQFSKRSGPQLADMREAVTKAVNEAFSSVQVRYSQDFGILLRRDVSKALVPVKDLIRDLHDKQDIMNKRIGSVEMRLGNIESMLNDMQTAMGQFLGKTLNVKFVAENKG